MLEGDVPAVYIGTEYSHSLDKGVVEWYGRLGTNNASTASFVLPVKGTVLGAFETTSGSYRVSKSPYGENYILCKADPTYPGMRID
jgi:hypothetical protein